jgi:hypothetical protein
MIILLMWYTNNDVVHKQIYDSCGTQTMIILLMWYTNNDNMIILLMWYTNNDNITHVVHKQ